MSECDRWGVPWTPVDSNSRDLIDQSFHGISLRDPKTPRPSTLSVLSLLTRPDSPVHDVR